MADTLLAEVRFQGEETIWVSGEEKDAGDHQLKEVTREMETYCFLKVPRSLNLEKTLPPFYNPNQTGHLRACSGLSKFQLANHQNSAFPIP